MHGGGEVNGSGSWIYLRKDMLKRIQTGVEQGLWVINVNHSSLVESLAGLVKLGTCK